MTLVPLLHAPRLGSIHRVYQRARRVHHARAFGNLSWLVISVLRYGPRFRRFGQRVRLRRPGLAWPSWGNPEPDGRTHPARDWGICGHGAQHECGAPCEGVLHLNCLARCAAAFLNCHAPVMRCSGVSGAAALPLSTPAPAARPSMPACARHVRLRSARGRLGYRDNCRSLEDWLESSVDSVNRLTASDKWWACSLSTPEAAVDCSTRAAFCWVDRSISATAWLI